jgi:hypothetical protein
VERKTVEFEHGENALRQKMAEWARDGWNVNSISKPTTRDDGSVVRQAELSRTAK